VTVGSGDKKGAGPLFAPGFRDAQGGYRVSHDSTENIGFISDRDPGDESDCQDGGYSSAPAPARDEHRSPMKTVMRARAPFPAGF